MILITGFNPSFALFVGIAGGLRNDMSIGDVIAADKVYGYESGKADTAFASDLYGCSCGRDGGARFWCGSARPSARLLCGCPRHFRFNREQERGGESRLSRGCCKTCGSVCVRNARRTPSCSSAVAETRRLHRLIPFGPFVSFRQLWSVSPPLYARRLRLLRPRWPRPQHRRNTAARPVSSRH